jgi:threonine dehydratase
MTAIPDKIKAIRDYDVGIVKIGTSYEDAYEEALRIQKKTGALMVHPYEDPLVLAGQATVGMEILDDNPHVDTVIVPIGGGGLICGIAFAVKNVDRSIRVIGVQSKNAPSMAEAFRVGRPVPVQTKPTLADGMVIKSASEITLAIIREYVDQIVLVSESDMKKAILALLREDHVLAEPSGAASVASIMCRSPPELGDNVAVVVSGGNISIDYLSGLLTRHKN